MLWITPPEILESVCGLFESLKPKVADTDQIFRLGSPFSLRILLKKGLHFLKGLSIPTKLIETIPRPK
jgi:hypothetical protein